MQIIVNGKSKKVGVSRDLSYTDLVYLAYGPGHHDILYTIAYTEANQPFKTSGMVAPGESVKVKEGTRIDVVYTGNA